MATVKDLLKAKFTQVWYVTPTSTVSDALKLLAEQQIGAVLVVEAGKIVGIFSERDFARKALLPEVNLGTPVGDLMVRGVYYVTPDQSVESCMAMMTAKPQAVVITIQPPCCPFDLFSNTLATTPSPRINIIIVPMTSAR